MTYNSLIIFLAVTFPYIVVTGSLLFLLFHKEVFTKKHPLKALLQKFVEIAVIFITGVFARLLANILKYIIHVDRPFIADPSRIPLFQKTGYSFPSDHATFFFALAMAVYFYHKPAGRILFLCAIVISLARVLAGVHYPIDVLGGAILGMLTAWVVYKVAKIGKTL